LNKSLIKIINDHFTAKFSVQCVSKIILKESLKISQYLTCYDKKVMVQFLTQSAHDDAYIKTMKTEHISSVATAMQDIIQS